MKRFLLHMPPVAARVLKKAGIDVATLANNHAMDFGSTGLFDTITALGHAGIQSTGAGADRDAAVIPCSSTIRDQQVCILAFSRTLPSSFWATPSRPGTAFADEDLIVAAVSRCAAAGRYTIVAFHWGQEMLPHALLYQRVLAHLAVDAGARLVIGHHPHVLQELEVYRGARSSIRWEISPSAANQVARRKAPRCG